MHIRRAVHLLASLLIVIAIARLITSRQPSGKPNSQLEGSQQPTLRIYDVSDIWQSLAQDWEACARAEALLPKRTQIDYGPNESASGAAPQPTTAPAITLGNSAGISSRSKQLATEQVTIMLIREITPNDWEDNGGSIASIAANDGFLMIWHTPAGHRQIEALLTAIRRADRIQWHERGAAAKQ